MGLIANLKERVAKALLGNRQAKQVQEAQEWLDGSSDEWRSITQTERDLSPIEHTRMLRISHFLAETNPMARLALRMYRDFTVGEGVSFSCEDEKVRDILDKFWTDPINDIEAHWDTWAWEIWRDGELILPVAENEHTGFIELGYIDPRQVKEVRTSKDNPLITEEVVVNQTAFQPERVYKIIQFNRQTGLYEIPEGGDGACFYFAVNSPTNATRGKSELLPAADWCDVVDKTLFSEVERTEFMKAFLWDITLKGADPAKVIAKENKLKKEPPRPGSFLAHNEEESWKALSPDMKHTDLVKFLRFLFNFAAMALGFPPHWFGQAEDVNRSTGDSMKDPVIKMLQAKAKQIKGFIQKMNTFVIHRAVAKGMLGKDALEAEVNVHLYDVSQKDAAEIAGYLKDLVISLQTASMEQWIKPADASRAFTMTANRLGNLNLIPIEEQEEAPAQESTAPKDGGNGNSKRKGLTYGDISKYAEGGCTCGKHIN